MAETKTSSVHTPTPWKLTSESSSRYSGFNRIIKADGMWLAIIVDDATFESENTKKKTQANAEFIVRAVNSYQELLDACKGIVSTYVFLDSLTAGMEPQHSNTLKALATIRAAIEKAETGD
jgi:hypothetical protein